MPSLNELYDHIRDFHVKHNSAYEVPIEGDVPVIEAFGDKLKRMSESALQIFRDDPTDEAALRAHLMMEELGELLCALDTGDRVSVIDAIGDLIYVVVGTAVCYGVRDLDGILTEIHRSNMTKPPKGDPRVKDKTGYDPPKLEQFA